MRRRGSASYCPAIIAAYEPTPNPGSHLEHDDGVPPHRPAARHPVCPRLRRLAYTDAFYIAFRLPNLLRRLFGEGAFSQAFVPILAEYKTQKGEAATKQPGRPRRQHPGLGDRAGQRARHYRRAADPDGIASGLDGDGFDKGVVMTRLMFPYIACMSFVVLSGAVLNTWREFKIPAFTPVLWNLSSIFFSLFLVKYFEVPIYSMAVAVMVGGVLQVAIQIPALKRIGMLPRLSFNPLAGLRDPGVRRILKKMGPAVFAVSAAQISLLINTNIASNWAAAPSRCCSMPTA
jgi:putative peptidoglycan lipid II flippase